MSAKYIQPGNTIDYIPSAAVAAGDVVIFGDLIGVAPRDIPAGELGTLDLCGVFEFPKVTGAITGGAKVYWNGSAVTTAENDGATSNPTAYKLIGHAVSAAGADDATVRVRIG